MFRVLTVALAGSGLLLAGTPAFAANGLRVDNGVYSKSVCKGPVAPNLARCFAHVVTDAAGNVKPGKMHANESPSGYHPADLQSAYAASRRRHSSTIVAIVDAYGYTNAEADLAVYRAQFGLPACTTANGCFRSSTRTGTTKNYPAAEHRLGAGIGPRPRHGQRHVPQLQDHPGRGQDQPASATSAAAENDGGRPGRPRDQQQLRRRRERLAAVRERLQPPGRRDHGQHRRRRLRRRSSRPPRRT